MNSIIFKTFASGNAASFQNGSRKHMKSMVLIFAKLNGMICSSALSPIVIMEFYRLCHSMTEAMINILPILCAPSI